MFWGANLWQGAGDGGLLVGNRNKCSRKRRIQRWEPVDWEEPIWNLFSFTFKHLGDLFMLLTEKIALVISSTNPRRAYTFVGYECRHKLNTFEYHHVSGVYPGADQNYNMIANI